MRSISTPMIETLTDKERNKSESWVKKSIKEDGPNEIKTKLCRIKFASEKLDALKRTYLERQLDSIFDSTPNRASY